MIHQAPPPALYQQLVTAAAETPQYEPFASFSFPHVEAPATTDRSKYNFAYGWFEGVRPGWEELTRSLINTPLQMLEIGSFEGCSTTWMLDELAGHPLSSLVAIDSFGGGNESTPSAYDDSIMEKRFWNNVELSKNFNKLKVMKGMSADALVQLRHEKSEFDFVYIDGSHTAVDVLADAMLVWPMLKEGGTMVFDDYKWYFYKQEYYNPPIAIEAFLRVTAPSINYFEKNGQLWVKKIANTTVPEPN